MRTSITKLFGPRRGSAAIEFGFWLPVLVLFVSAVVDYGVYMNTRVSIARGAMEGCRAGSAYFEKDEVAAGSVMGPTAVSRANQVLSDLGIPCPDSKCTSTATYCPVGASGACNSPPFDALLVTVTYTFTPPIGLLPVPETITERFMMAAENQRSDDD